jgi:diguanylate cyclase (GGDEF)-like protein
MIRGPVPGAVQPVGHEPIVLGRDEALSCRIDDSGMSRQHARVYRDEVLFYVEDLGSTNGTRLNGEFVEAPIALKDGDRIQLGANTVLRVAVMDAHEAATQQKLYAAAVLDALTQVFNRGYFEERLASEFAFAQRHNNPLSLLLFDLDHFKEVNDTHGHLVGDEVLRRVSASLKETIRREDVLARYGGEEFVLIARGIDGTGAFVLAERARVQVEALRIGFEAGAIEVTTSVGVATLYPESPFQHPAELVAAADRAVYRAKDDGRNRVVLAE